MPTMKIIVVVVLLLAGALLGAKYPVLPNKILGTVGL